MLSHLLPGNDGGYERRTFIYQLLMISDIYMKKFVVFNSLGDAIVEVPARVDAEGVHPIKVGELPEVPAAICHRQISIQNLPELH